MRLENINQRSPTASKVIPSPLPAGGFKNEYETQSVCMDW